MNIRPNYLVEFTGVYYHQKSHLKLPEMSRLKLFKKASFNYLKKTTQNYSGLPFDFSFIVNVELAKTTLKRRSAA